MKSKTPWIVQTSEENIHGYKGWNSYCIRSAENYCLAVVGRVDHATEDNNKANAHLMAAAPELLAALANIVNNCDMGDFTMTYNGSRHPSRASKLRPGPRSHPKSNKRITL